MALEKLSPAQKVRSIVGALVTEPNRKSVPLMIREFATLARRDRELPKYYFTNFLYRRQAGPATNYVGRRARELVHDRLGEPRDADLDQKLRFYARASRAGLPVPRLLATIHPDRIEIGGEPRPARTAEAIMAALDDARSISRRGSIFVKPNDGKSGQGCFRIDRDTAPQEIERIAAGLRGVYLVQETLAQHPGVAPVSPSALGCLRVHTYREGDEAHILSTLMRFAFGSGVIDTPSQGAMFAAVEEQTGRVVPPALTHFQLGGREYSKHPETGASFAIMLPDWPRVLELVDQATGTFDKPFIGWDIGFTVEGPVLLEGNNTPDLMLAQIAARGLRNHPRFWPVIEQVIDRTKPRPVQPPAASNLARSR